VSGGEDAVERTHFSEITAAWPPTASSATATAPGSNREWAAKSPSPHLIPIDRGILATIYVRVAPGTTEEALADACGAHIGGGSSAWWERRCPDQARRAHQLLRHRLARRPSGRVILVSVIDNLLKGASGRPSRT
jgi:N-acetyl-gamma-glutamyl-phosphate reductase